MNRYPTRQEQCDREGCRPARLRPGATVRVQGVVNGIIGPLVEGRVLISKASDLAPEVDAVLVSTREYGRRWFHTRGHPFRVVEEICV